MSPPIAFLDHRKFLKYLLPNSALDSPHDIRWRDIGWRGNQNMHMIFTDNTQVISEFQTAHMFAGQALALSKPHLPAKRDSGIW